MKVVLFLFLLFRLKDTSFEKKKSTQRSMFQCIYSPFHTFVGWSFYTLFIIIIIIGNKEKELFELKEKGYKIHRKKVHSNNKVKGYLDSKSLPNITQGHSFISCKLQLYLHGMKLLARILKFQQTFICSEIKLKR